MPDIDPAPNSVASPVRAGREWWRTSVVYQVYPRSFSDSDGDGVGDLRGVTARLDHLVRLGADVLWLSPVYPSPQADNGYDISDYRDVDPLFGSLADLDELIAESHARGIKVLMDLVVNHTSDQHPWFLESRSSVKSPKRDWYWWRPPRSGHPAGGPGAEPTNWGSFFSGPAWTLDEESGEYYLHLFSRHQPDLNWENPEVRAAIHDMMRWWLDRGVDGFRMDVINMVSKALPLRDGPVPAGGGLGDGSAYYLGGPRIHEFLAEMHEEVFVGRHGTFLTVGEMPGVTVEEARLFTDPARRELDMVFTFEHVSVDHGGSKWEVKPLSLPALKAVLGRWQTGLARTGWNSLYWSNHDQPRVVSRFGNDGVHRVRSAKLLATVLHLHRGTPFVYQGEELGMTNAPFGEPDDFRDVESLNRFHEASASGSDREQVMASLRAMSRDNARTPMQWDGSRHAGFTTGEPWLPVNPNHVHVNAEAAIADDESVFHHYRRLIELRRTEPAVVHGDFTMLLPDHDTVYAFVRRHAGRELLVVANFSSQPVIPDLADFEEWVSSAELLVRNDLDATGVMLGPWEARVYRREVAS